MRAEQRETSDARVSSASEVAGALLFAARDVRQRRPPLLSFMLRLATLRRIARVTSLLALDYMGVVGALFTVVPEVSRLPDTEVAMSGDLAAVGIGVAIGESKEFGPGALFVTVVLAKGR